MADTLPEFLSAQELHTLTGYARPGRHAVGDVPHAAAFDGQRND